MPPDRRSLGSDNQTASDSLDSVMAMIAVLLVKLYRHVLRQFRALPALAERVLTTKELPPDVLHVVVEPQLFVRLAAVVTLAADGAERTAAG
jgi:hypothetical protein